MEATNINLSVETNDTPQRAVLAGNENNNPAAIDAFNPETEARQLLEIMGIAGVLPPETVNTLLGPAGELTQISDAEIVEDEENNEPA